MMKMKRQKAKWSAVLTSAAMLMINIPVSAEEQKSLLPHADEKRLDNHIQGHSSAGWRNRFYCNLLSLVQQHSYYTTRAIFCQ